VCALGSLISDGDIRSHLDAPVTARPVLGLGKQLPADSAMAMTLGNLPEGLAQGCQLVEIRSESGSDLPLSTATVLSVWILLTNARRRITHQLSLCSRIANPGSRRTSSTNGCSTGITLREVAHFTSLVNGPEGQESELFVVGRAGEELFERKCSPDLIRTLGMCALPAMRFSPGNLSAFWSSRRRQKSLASGR
jgi:hypothetical protein